MSTIMGAMRGAAKYVKDTGYALRNNLAQTFNRAAQKLASVKARASSGGNSEQTICAICRDVIDYLNGPAPHQTPCCGQTFHAHCLDQWSRSCPLCRSEECNELNKVEKAVLVSLAIADLVSLLGVGVATTVARASTISNPSGHSVDVAGALTSLLAGVAAVAGLSATGVRAGIELEKVLDNKYQGGALKLIEAMSPLFIRVTLQCLAIAVVSQFGIGE